MKQKKVKKQGKQNWICRKLCSQTKQDRDLEFMNSNENVLGNKLLKMVN